MFIVIFLVLMGVFTFYVANFLPRRQADLQPFFIYHPWLYLFLVPALGMRLWAEERKTGTVELLLTLPISMIEAVMGKFLAAWTMIALALAARLTGLAAEKGSSAAFRSPLVTAAATRPPHSSDFRKPCSWTFLISLPVSSFQHPVRPR